MNIATCDVIQLPVTSLRDLAKLPVPSLFSSNQPLTAWGRYHGENVPKDDHGRAPVAPFTPAVSLTSAYTH